MRYAIDSADTHSIASSTGSYAEYVYRANSPYDPYQTGAGAQPRTFDQWMSLWRNGIVLGAKLHVIFIANPGDSTFNAMRVGVTGKDSTTVASETELGEGRDATSKILTAQSDKVIVNKYYSYKFFAKDPNDEANLEFSNTSNATTQYFWHVGGFALNGATETCHFTGFIDYICLLKQPHDPAQS